MALSTLFNKDVIRKNCHPMCFYLKWTDQGQPNMPKYVAQWTNIDELDRHKITWKTTVNWKEIGDIMLATDLAPGSDERDPAYLNKGSEATYSNKSYLKSHLQKAVRRSCIGKALKTAVHFLDIDPVDFLRRLCIIAIEDALPLDGYSTLVWMMAASSKEYSLTNSHVGWLLGYVHDLAKCGYYEQFGKETITPLKSLKLFKQEQAGRNLCYSIMLRHNYGGMRGDKEMCHAATVMWQNRFSTKSRFLTLLERSPIFITFPTAPLHKGEWILAAIDFHCYPGICDKLWEKHDIYTTEQIKQAIWHCSSCVTNKRNIAADEGQRQWDNSSHRKVWLDIRKDFNSIARFMISVN